MRLLKVAALTVLSLSLTSQAVFAQTDVEVGGTIDKNPPSVTITNPSDGATVSGTIDVDASATDDVGVTKVEFSVDGSLVSTDTSAPFGFKLDTTTLTEGSHTILARAFDAENKTGTDSITINVDQSVPTTTLKSPTNKIQEPVIGPPTIATKPAGPKDRTIIVQIPEDQKAKGFLPENKDFLLGLAIGIELLILIFLIIWFRRRKKKNTSTPEVDNKNNQ
jgi:hypothetical protein